MILMRFMVKNEPFCEIIKVCVCKKQGLFMRRKSWLCLLALFLTTMVLHSPAAAGEASTDASVDVEAAIKAGDISRQIDWIQASLDAGGASAKRWQYGWSTAYGGLTYLYAVQADSLDEDDQTHARYDAVVNSAGAFVGLVGTLAFPLKTSAAAETLRAMPASTPAQRQAKLRQAETLLRESAEREALGRSWQAHAFGAAVGALAGAAVASDGGRSEDGLLMFATNLLVSELQIFTTPTRATKAWRRYQLGDAGKFAALKPGSGFSVSLLPRGIVFNYHF
jgi:hypothetical protein